MAFKTGSETLEEDHLKLINDIITNAIVLKRYIYSKGDTPETLWNDTWIEALNNSDGDDSSIDTANTTAEYVSINKKYINSSSLGSIIASDSTEKSTNYSTYQLVKTITLTTPSYVYKHTNEVHTSNTNVLQYCKIRFYYEDSTYHEVAYEIRCYSTYCSQTYENPDKTKKVTKIEVYLKANSSTIYERNDNVYDLTFNDSILQTTSILSVNNPTSISWHVVADIPNGANITVDVSYDGGTTFAKTGLSSTDSIDVSAQTSVDIVLKINMNMGTSSEPISIYGFGVTVSK